MTVLVLRSLARRILVASEEADELEHEILDHIHALAPQLLDEPGVRPIVAARSATVKRGGREITAAALGEKTSTEAPGGSCRTLPWIRRYAPRGRGSWRRASKVATRRAR